MFYIRYPRLCPLLAHGAASSVAAATNLASIPRPFLRFLHRECAISCEYDVHTMYFAAAFDQWRVQAARPTKRCQRITFLHAEPIERRFFWQNCRLQYSVGFQLYFMISCLKPSDCLSYESSDKPLNSAKPYA